MNNRNLPVIEVNLSARWQDAAVQLPGPEREIFYDHLTRGAAPESLGCAPASHLGEAAFAGRTGIVKELLASGASSTDKIQALHFAVYKGFLAIVNLLLACGTDPNTVDDNGSTALHTAAYYGHFDIFTALLDKGAIATACNALGCTALDEAAISGHTEIVKALLNRGAKPTNALLVSAAHGHLATVKELLANDADPNISDTQGCTALHKAAKHGRIHILRLLLANGADPNKLDTKGCTALNQAAIYGRTDILTTLLARGAIPGMCPMTLVAAAGHGYLKIVDLLLTHGANLNAPDESGTRALHQAVVNGHTDVVNTLLANGADPNAPDGNGISALHQAADKGHTDVVNALLTNGARPSMSADALVAAASCGWLEIVKTLLANGAMPDTPDKNKCTALQQAELKGHTGIVDVLKNHIPQLNPDSLPLIARTCIRKRLIERQRDGGQLLSSSIAELPLPESVKKYVYGHLSQEAGSPGEALESDRVYSSSLPVDISL